MKSRSYRHPVSEPRHDDWVDGSWTVDCICGVNYDDGEEMVDCDECGVWVHTRCSRYVKSEKSFACDKCKSKNSANGLGNDSEEAEVAEFLVELPTKTLRMDNLGSVGVAPRRPFRLWTDVPMEERVHEQGVPGGEPGLFLGSGMSSIFGPSLWKATGYVPKKFNFRYNDFPCLDHGMSEEKKEEELGKMSGEENVVEADNGAGVLFSLLKENDIPMHTPVADSVGVKNLVEGGGCHENTIFSCPKDGLKRKSSSVPIVLNFGRRKKEGLEMLKDQIVRRKPRTVVEDRDVKKRANASKGVLSTASSDVKHLESSQNRGSKDVNIQCGLNVCHDQQTDGLGECATNLASNGHALEATCRNDVTSEEMSSGGNVEDQVHVRSKNFSKTNNGGVSLTELNGSLSHPVKEEVSKDALWVCGDVERGTENAETGSHDKDFVAVDAEISSPGSKGSLHGQSSDIGLSNSRPNKKLKGEPDADNLHPHHAEPLPLNDVKLETMKVTTPCPNLCANVVSEVDKVIDPSVINSEACNPKLLDATRSLIVGNSKTDTCEGPSGGRKQSSGTKYRSSVADELHKSNGTTRGHSTASYQRKTLSLVKSTSTLGGNISKPLDNHTTSTIQNPSHGRRSELSESAVEITKDNISADKVEHKERFVRPRKLVKEHSKHLSKIPESTELLLMSDSEKLSSDSKKGSSIHSSSKVPSVSNVAFNPVSGECGISSSNVRIKAAAAVAETGKIEKLSQSASAKNAASMSAPTPANVPATLRDEELALLLHQELNSSPRVPRVPRMRHAGSLPQLTSPSASNVLIMRTSSCGGKDQIVASRKRTKYFSGEGPQGFVEVDNEAKEIEKKPHIGDLVSTKEADCGRAKSVQSIKKATMGSPLSSTKAVCDDQGMVGHLTNRTLPCLIAEIMKEGKQMTYGELCNSVKPHWPHLRKHNGERYAYSSHNQAVLDCLRNRSEWARLVDRGPKANPNRKRRKFESDSVGNDSEDDEEKRAQNLEDSRSKSFQSYQDDFPKGKRKARKRRRRLSDDESENLSNSTREDNSTPSEEEEIQDGGSEASARSDEV